VAERPTPRAILGRLQLRRLEALGQARAFVAGARPRTLPASLVPVAVGTAVGVAVGGARAWRAGAALVVSVAIQVGTNYANDYADGVRGTDRERVGPTRLVAGGLASPRAVRRAALASFGVAGGVGLALASAVSWWLVPVGAACLAAGWLYTGGPHPYGYLGLGEMFAFVFFGVVAVVGTTFVVCLRLSGEAALAAVPVGLLSVALLVVNNLRDLRSDAAAGKRTLAVRLGEARTRQFYAATMLAPAGAVLPLARRRPGVLLSLAAMPLLVGPARAVLRGATGGDLVPVLGATGRAQLVFGGLLALGILTGARAG
jgi:1,4-dihydroxy-2-naphthoate octaprenyltransferase